MTCSAKLNHFKSLTKFSITLFPDRYQLTSCCLVTQLYPTLATPWTVALKAPLSMGFQESWSGLPFPSAEDLSDQGIEPVSPAVAGGFFTTEPPGKPNLSLFNIPFSPGSCFQSQPLCCVGMDHHCRRGSCYCDEFCHVVPDCCPDHHALCKPRNAHAGSFPPPGELDAVTDRGKPLPILQAKARVWTG